VLEADEEVTIFFRAGVFPNNGISVGLQEWAIKISEPIDSLSSSLRCADDLRVDIHILSQSNERVVNHLAGREGIRYTCREATHIATYKSGITKGR
jgi:hypothetical protein